MATEGCEQIVCRCYTRARRHPRVIGRFGVLLTTTECVGAALAALAMVSTRAVWAHLGGVGNVVVGLGVPVAVVVALRLFRVESRSPLRTGLGYVSSIAGPRHGVANGRPVHDQPPRQPRQPRWVFVWRAQG